MRLEIFILLLGLAGLPDLQGRLTAVLGAHPQSAEEYNIFKNGVKRIRFAQLIRADSLAFNSGASPAGRLLNQAAWR
jgi:hypothetical protein